MWSRASGIVLGLLLVGVGAVLLAVNTFGMELPFDFGRIGWPVFVIAPGFALLLVGLLTSGEAGVGLSVAGGIVTTVGLILSYQYSTDHWSSWAYAWALIAPTAVGIAMFLWGLFHRRGDLVRQGLSGFGVGVVLFIVGFAFFEGVLGIGDDRGLAPLGRQALPVALIVAGALIILSRLWPRRRETPPPVAYTEWPPPSPAPWSTPGTQPPLSPSRSGEFRESDYPSYAGPDLTRDEPRPDEPRPQEERA